MIYATSSNLYRHIKNQKAEFRTKGMRELAHINHTTLLIHGRLLTFLVINGLQRMIIAMPIMRKLIPKTSTAPSPETLAMIDSVQKAQAAVDPMKITVFMSAERAKLLQQRVESTSGLNKVNFMVMWGFEELKAGNTECCYQTLPRCAEMVKPLEIPGKEQTVLEMKKAPGPGCAATWRARKLHPQSYNRLMYHTDCQRRATCEKQKALNTRDGNLSGNLESNAG